MTAATRRIIDSIRRAHAKLKTYHSLSKVAGDEFSDTLQMREQSGVDYYRALAIEVTNADRDPDEMMAKAEFLRLLWNHWPDIHSALKQQDGEKP